MLVHEILIPVLALVTGLLLGLLGSGGSVLALPAFVYAASIPIKSAVATSLLVVGTTSLIGAVVAKRRCNTHGCPGQEVDTRVTFLMTVGGLTGAYAGSRISTYVPSSVQMILFGAVMLIAASGMFRRKSPTLELVNDPTSLGRPLTVPRAVVVSIGLGVGLLTGIVGVGGGFLIVPALTVLARVPVKRAAAMSLWIIAANATAGLVGYIGHVAIAWSTAGLFVGFSIVGLIVGQRIAAGAPALAIQRAFGVFLIAVGGFTILKNVQL